MSGGRAASLRAIYGRIGRRALIVTPLLGMLPLASRFTASEAQVATPISESGDATYSPRAAVAWLADQQRSDGGFAGPSGETDLETTIDAIFAAYALGLRVYPSRVMDAAVNYLLPRSAEYAARGPAAAARLALVAVMLDSNLGWAPDVELVVSQSSEDCANVYWPDGAALLPQMTAPPTTP
jgi:hypothetical protein